MGTKITTLKGKTSGDDVYPNILQANIPDGAVSNAKIADGTIQGNKIAAYTISGGKITPGSINKLCLGNNAVGTDELENLSVTTGKIANNGVTAAKLLIVDDNDEWWGSGSISTLDELYAIIHDWMTEGRFIRFYYEYQGDIRNVTISKCAEHDDIIVDVGTDRTTISTDANAASFFSSYISNGAIHCVYFGN